MTRVPPSGPPSGRPPLARPASARPGTPQRPGSAALLRPRRPGAKVSSGAHVEKEKQAKLKPGSSGGAEDGAEQAHEAPRQEGPGAGSVGHEPHEHAAHAELWAPESHAEKVEDKKARDEVHEANERAEGSGDPAHQKGFLKQIKPALKAPNSPLQQKKALKDGFEQQAGAVKTGSNLQTLQARQAQAVKATAQVQAPITTPPAPPSAGRPPDAFTVLHAAQEPGVYFREDGHHGAAEQEDPELTAAIEEAIRLLFGVRGILRVTGGFDQAQHPAIIIVATQGFGEASLKLVPPKVHRFETILAVPYDMLPLKRERL